MKIEDEIQKRIEFENWIRENGSLLCLYINKQVRNKELAEDLYQEVLISAYLNLEKFEARANFKSWIYKIAINKCRDFWRKQKVVQKFWEEKVYHYEIEKSIPQPEDYVLTRCSTEEMLDALNELPTIYQEPILLYYFKGKSLREISLAKKLPIATVKTRIRRAKKN
ncbi:RNA polymerase sigma factor [Robertmurraya sp. DFI.2.37]|uniref:RNA polymerase sigma factor n=1 Tax=Robertmurraya sp. DFI.2.37 TaxID=3031819 RepID=UPI001246A398|nr:RNA polymerase sigma factor [Robertmurraya sp. DFI.2.37]MDF1507151.1 RNA polymerase sigma factor [Robertmurraya sp. DFI.2.37]